MNVSTYIDTHDEPHPAPAPGQREPDPRQGLDDARDREARRQVIERLLGLLHSPQSHVILQAARMILEECPAP